MTQQASTPEYAGFWRRFAALLIDGILTLHFFSAFFFITNMLAGNIIAGTDYQQGVIIAAILSAFWLFMARWCYYAAMESSPLQATIGKLAAGLYVTNMEGRRPSFGQATGRYFGKTISELILCIGFLMAGVTKNKQALHDRMSGCLVLAR